MSCTGVAALLEARRLRQAAAVRQPRWCAFLFVVGVAGLGGGAARLWF